MDSWSKLCDLTRESSVSDNLLYCHLNLLTAALSFITAHKPNDKQRFVRRATDRSGQLLWFHCRRKKRIPFGLWVFGQTDHRHILEESCSFVYQRFTFSRTWSYEGWEMLLQAPQTGVKSLNFTHAAFLLQSLKRLWFLSRFLSGCTWETFTWTRKEIRFLPLCTSCIWYKFPQTAVEELLSSC